MIFLHDAGNRNTFFERIATFFPRTSDQYVLIEQAYQAAKDAFRGKTRDGGTERYFEHLRAVALILILWLRVKDHELIIAALLHDIVEDIPSWTIERVEREFGRRVAQLIDWLTKPRKDEYPDKHERDRVYHQRLVRAPREAIIIKLADRFHNVSTLDSVTPDKRRRKITETREHYLPLAEQEIILIHELDEALAMAERL